ncbi:MAG: enoyl-CoA hydratase-related protein [Burkholderiaceae bacterium]
MNPDTYKNLSMRRDGKVLHVSFNRPDSLNAFDAALHDEFERFIFEVPRDDATHVVVLSGVGKAFSAGGDVEQMQLLVDQPQRMYPEIGAAKRLIQNFLDIPQPVVAKINGAAMGLGSTLALFSDISFAANHAKIADPHVKVGYVAGDGGAVIWPQLIGYARAKQYLLTGDIITGEEAAKIGLINFAHPAEELDAAVDAFAQRLAGGARRAVQWTKATINVGLKQLAASMMDAGMAYETLSNHTRDHAEAVAAFRGKRSPQFTGD